MMWRLWVVWLGVLLSGCAGVEVKHYAAQQPALHLEQYFNGRVEAWGMFQKRNGEVVKRFQVQIDASWQGERGILDESFRYSDGSTQRRVWQLQRVAEGRYVGRADDVEGEAVGEVSGNALRWRYVLRLPVDGVEYRVDFDDWMYLIDSETMVNRSVMSKFGVELGQVTLFFRRRPA